MSTLWIERVRFNGGDMMAAGQGCNLQAAPLMSTIVVQGSEPRRLGMRTLLQAAAFVPEDGYFECWGPNNHPDGDPALPYGYVGLNLMKWEPTAMPDGTIVPHAYSGVQLSEDIQAVADTGALMPFNGWAYVPTLHSVDELAANAIPDTPEEA